MLTPYYADPLSNLVVYQSHCEESPPSDVSQYAGTTTLGGSGVTTSSIGRKSGSTSLSFGGAGYIVLPNTGGLQLTGEYCVEMFIQYTTLNCFFSLGSTNYFYNNSYLVNNTSIAATVGAASTPKHLAFTRDSSNIIRVYFDGTKIGSGTVAGTVDYRGLNIGRYSPNNNLFYKGYIDDIRITNGNPRYTSDTTITVPTAPNIAKLQTPTTPYIKRPLRVNGNKPIRSYNL